MRKIRRPIIDPCGTPEVIGGSWKDSPLTLPTTVWEWLTMADEGHCQRISGSQRT